MHVFSSPNWRVRASFAVVLALLLTLTVTSLTFASGGVPLVKLSHDPYTNSSSQHKTQVEPDIFSYGSTIVAAVQTGRFPDGGSSNTGWATSTNGGSSWTHGFLPGTTVYATPKGKYTAISDPAVAYDAAHSTWLISGLAILGNGPSSYGAAVLVSQSTNGGTTWSNPVTVATTNGFYDKDWIVCDSTASSPDYGHCYVEWDDAANGDSVLMSTSTNGGNSWGTGIHPSGAGGLGGQPLVQPNGTVIVPYLSNSNDIAAFKSTNGGTSWSSSVNVASIQSSFDPGNIRSGPLPSAEIDGAGNVYVVWEDCRFESGCSANDIVMSTSANGTTWSSVVRIPIDPVGSGVDHLLPGIGADITTSGSSAHLALVYYYFPTTNCSSSTCKLDVGYVSSTNGGSTWSAKTKLAGPMTLTWLANTDQGYMVGDYMAAAISNGKAFPAFIVAKAPKGSIFNEALYSVSGGLVVSGGKNAVSNKVLSPGAPEGGRVRIAVTAF